MKTWLKRFTSNNSQQQNNNSQGGENEGLNNGKEAESIKVSIVKANVSTVVGCFDGVGVMIT